VNGRRATASPPYDGPVAQEGDPAARRRAKRRTEALPRLHVVMGGANKLLGFLNEPARAHFQSRGVDTISISFDPADPLTVVLRGDASGRRIDPRGYVYVTPLRGHVEPPADIVLRAKGAALTGRTGAGAETSHALRDAAALVADARESLQTALPFLRVASHRVAADVATFIADVEPKIRRAERDLLQAARGAGRGRRTTATKR